MVNTSGIIPVDLRILVKPDPVEEKIGSIYMPDQAKDKAKYAATKATLVAAGSNAFKEWGDAAMKPKPGSRVLFAQYTGARERGDDGEDYIIMNDGDLLAIKEIQ
jgi:co-chaperonin GroES (HSP10)